MRHGTRRQNKPFFFTSCFCSWCFVIAKEVLTKFRTYQLSSGNKNCKQQVKSMTGAGLVQSSLPVLVVSAQHAPCSSLNQHFRLWNPAQQDRNHVYSPGWFPFEESSRFLTHLKIRLDSGMQNLFLLGYLPLLSHWWGGMSYDCMPLNPFTVYPPLKRHPCFVIHLKSLFFSYF